MAPGGGERTLCGWPRNRTRYKFCFLTTETNSELRRCLQGVTSGLRKGNIVNSKFEYQLTHGWCSIAFSKVLHIFL